MSKTGRSRRKTAGLLALTVTASLAVLVGSLASPARADLITFNPTAGGSGAGAISGVQSFNYNPGNVLAQGLATPTVGASYNVFYQSALGGITGPSGPVASVGIGGNVNSSGNEFTVVAGFRETITGLSPVPGGGSNINGPGSSGPGTAADAVQVSFSLASGEPNFFRIFAQPAGTSNTSAGSGFVGATPILTGHLVPSGFSGTFKQDGAISGTNFIPHTENFNQSGAASPLDTTPTRTSVTGSGGTNILVAVDSANPAYFPIAPLLFSLNFTTTNSLPFTGATPTDTFYNGTSSITGNPGSTNGVTGPDFMFQSVAQNNFTVVPEPSTIVPALTAATVIPSFLMLFKRLRRAKPLVA